MPILQHEKWFKTKKCQNSTILQAFSQFSGLFFFGFALKSWGGQVFFKGLDPGGGLPLPLPLAILDLFFGTKDQTIFDPKIDCRLSWEMSFLP